MKTKLLLQLYRPYLTVAQADEIRAEAMALKASLYFVMADWPWIEVRGLTEKRGAAFLEMLKARGVKFREIEKKKVNNREEVKV
jgi:hypothetical protein